MLRGPFERGVQECPGRTRWLAGAPLAGAWTAHRGGSAPRLRTAAGALDEGGELPEVYRHAFLFTHHRLLDRNSAPTLHVPSSSQSPLSHLTQLPHTVTSLSLFTQS